MAYSRNFLTTAGASFDIAPIQAGVPVLDQDLNLFQTAQFEARREYLRRETPSGWLDEIQHQPVVAANSAAGIGQIYCTGNDLDLRIRGDLDVIVDGMVVRLSHCCGQSSQPAGDASSPFSGITLPAAPSPTFQPANGVTSRVGSRVDLVFLEVWRKEITVPASNSAADRRLAGLADDGNYFNYGNTQPGTSTLPTLTNDMVDPAVGGETCRRVQTQYRLRVWQDVDASSTTHPLAQSVKAWPSHKRTSSDGVSESTYTYSAVPDDVGLFRAGDGSTAAKSALGTFDGYCYAIPIALVSRRNTGAWSYTNFNGSTGRPDGKTANIHADDILDIRHNVAVGNKFDLKKLYETTRNLVLTCDLRTSYEEWMMNADGDNEYNPTGIYGTKLLRVEGVAGYASPINNSFQQTYQLQHNKVAQNGISTALDGMRNYFSDVGGDQAVFGMIPNVGSDGVGSSPQLFASYTASTRTLVLNAANMQSGGGTDPNRTKISVREPQLIWGKVGSHTHSGLNKGNSFKVSGTWSGLGTDSASFVIDDFTYFIADFAGTIPDSVNVGDVYKSSNNVDCIVTGFGVPKSYYVTFKYYGTTVPEAGAMTKVSGNGPSTIICRLYRHQFTYYVSGSITGIKVNDVYSSPDGLNFEVMFIVGNIIRFVKLNPTSYTDPASHLGTWTKVSGNGPSTITTTKAFFPYGERWAGTKQSHSHYVGVGSNFVPSDSPIHITAYVTFAPGSGVLSRIPYKNSDSIKATHFNLNVSGNPVQQLPNNGVGFVPFGTSADSLDNGRGMDTHTRQTGMIGFLHKGKLLRGGYANNSAIMPCVIKDGSTYKMWFSGYDGSKWRILYATSSDGLNWSNSSLALDTSSQVSSWESPSVIKDGSTYKMWVSGFDTSDNKYKIFYCTSSEGITWSSPVLVIDVNTDVNGRNSVRSRNPWVIKDGSTYKMWFCGNSDILYATSNDGISWDISPQGFCFSDTLAERRPCVIKEGSIYKIIFSYDRDKLLGYAYSIDGVNWSDFEILKFSEHIPWETGGETVFLFPCLIKDGRLYKLWISLCYSGRIGFISHAILSMTDPNNTGSSTTGVYPTTGSLNLAPPADSQVVIMYEAPSDQHDRTTIGTQTYMPPFYTDEKFYLTSFNTAKYLPDFTNGKESFRDFPVTYFPIYNNSKIYQYSSYPIGNAYVKENTYSPDSVYDYFVPIPTVFGARGQDPEMDYIEKRFWTSANIQLLTNSGFTSAGVPLYSSGNYLSAYYFMADLSVVRYMSNTFMASFELFNLSKKLKMALRGSTAGDGIMSFGGIKILNPLGRPVLK